MERHAVMLIANGNHPRERKISATALDAARNGKDKRKDAILACRDWCRSPASLIEADAESERAAYEEQLTVQKE